MAQTYTVKVLNEDEWKKIIESNIRYEKVDDDNLGFADPPNKVAYARKSYLRTLPGMKEYVLKHEFDHLLSDEKLHQDEHGVRHKKGFIRNALAIGAAPFTGGSSLLLSSPGQHPVIGSENTFLNKASNTIYKYAPPVIGAAIGGPGGAAAGSALSSFAQGQSPARTATNAGISAFASGGFNALTGKPLFGSNFPGFGATTTSGASGSPAGASTPTVNLSGVPSGLSRLASGIRNTTNRLNPLNIFGQGGSTGGGGGGGGTPTAGGSFNFNFQNPSLGSLAQSGATLPGNATSTSNPFTRSILSNPLLQLGGSALALGIGESKKTPTVPDFAQIPSIAALRTNAGQPNSPLGRLAQTDLSSQLSQQFTGLPNESRASIQRIFDRRRQEVASQFKLFRPNADQATDFQFRQAMEDIDRQQAETTSNAELNYRQQFEANRRQDISSALGVDTQTLNQLTQLAQLDIDQISIQLGIDAAEAQRFKQNFGGLAGILASGGLGLNQFQVPTTGRP